MNGVRRTIVKVCGLTSIEDASWALECGADWLGFIVAATGPRAITPEAMAAIMRGLPPGTVGVAVAEGLPYEAALALARRSNAVRLQMHGAEPGRWPADSPVPVAFVTRIDAHGVADGPLAPEPHLVQFDTAHATLAGGTGRTFPWERARALCGERPFMLAGGLGPDNVADAIATARPFGVDASSRLESAPGIKDRERVRGFVRAVRAVPGTQVED